MDAVLRDRLLESIEAQRLVVIAGAGLSMAAPSSLPGAAAIAERCYDKYSELGTSLDPALRSDLGKLASHFVEAGKLRPYFVDKLVPWGQFNGKPNPGHATIADFLLCRVLYAAVTTNYDRLVERYTDDFKDSFEVSLDAWDAARTAAAHGPYLKLHGDISRRQETIWAVEQLTEEPIRSTVASCKTWLAANLLEKDLLFVGFWSDWDYLNKVLEEALNGIRLNSVTIVSLLTEAELKAKAPDLWSVIEHSGALVRVVQASGADFLDELRVEFSQVFLGRVFRAGEQGFQKIKGVAADAAWSQLAGMSSEDLYAVRQDAEGMPRIMPAKRTTPQNSDIFATAHFLLLSAGATRNKSEYVMHGQTVRLVNACGRDIDAVRADYADEPPSHATDITIAAGADDLGLHASVVRSGSVGSLVRPAPSGRWLTLDEAEKELAL